MNKFMVDSINELSEIYNSIKKRVTNTKKLLESDRMFIKFYHDFINGVFNIKEKQ